MRIGVKKMKTVTQDQFKTFHPCWLETEEGRKRLEEIGSRKEEWTALDVLDLEDVSPGDRLWAVLREDFISSKILYKFACFLYKRALKTDYSHEKRNLHSIEVDLEYAVIAVRSSVIGLSFKGKLTAALICVRYAIGDFHFDYDVYSIMCAEQKQLIEEIKKMLLEEKEREENEK